MTFPFLIYRILQNALSFFSGGGALLREDPYFATRTSRGKNDTGCACHDPT